MLFFHEGLALIKLSAESCFFCQCGVSCVIVMICGLFSSIGCFSFVSNEVEEVRGNGCVGFLVDLGRMVSSLACVSFGLEV